MELGAGHGRDATFFASNGIEVEALDYSVIAVGILDKIAKEKRLPIKPRIFDVKNPLPFSDGYFNAVYSHMLLNMHFSLYELHFIFSEIRRVLKPKGLNFFSVRNHNDKSYSRGIEIDKGIYDINGFQIRFFTEKEISRILQISQPTINRDISYMRQQSKENIKKYVDERLPEEYEKCLVGITAILREAWTTSHRAQDKKERIQALSLAKECYSMKLDLLTNATVVDDAIRFVSSSNNQKEEEKAKANCSILESQEDSSSDDIQGSEKENNQQRQQHVRDITSTSTTTTNQTF